VQPLNPADTIEIHHAVETLLAGFFGFDEAMIE
jgi:hypothetical protein